LVSGDAAFEDLVIAKITERSSQLDTIRILDDWGSPLQLHSFEANKAETLTPAPVLDGFRRAHPNLTVGVACDARMLSASNRTALEDAGYGFIAGSRSRRP
jgi:hypothetical protein